MSSDALQHWRFLPCHATSESELSSCYEWVHLRILLVGLFIFPSRHLLLDLGLSTRLFLISGSDVLWAGILKHCRH